MRQLLVSYAPVPPVDWDDDNTLLLDWATVRSMARLSLAEAMINAGDVGKVVIVGIAATSGWRLFVGRPVYFAHSVPDPSPEELQAAGRLQERQLS